MATKLLLHMDGDQSTSVSGVDGYTKLLLHMDDTGLTDSSAYNHTITKGGGAARSGTESKFGSYSAYFDGSGDYLSIADSDDFNFFSSLSDKYTLECWIYLTGGTKNQIFSQFVDTDHYLWFAGSPDKLEFFGLSNGYIIPIMTGDTTISYNEWHHVALVKDGIIWSMFLDGNIEGSTIQTGTAIYDTDLKIGWNAFNSGWEFEGYIDEIRISKGIARWTSNFTPPTEAYSGRHITVNGNPKLDTSTKKFGSSSMYFDGTGDYLSVPDSSDFDFGSDDFVIDFWAAFGTTSPGVTMFLVSNGSQGSSADHDGWCIQYRSDNTIRFYGKNSAAGYLTASWTPNIGQLYHIALVRDGATSYTFYIDGVALSGSGNPSSLLASSDPLYIGRGWEGWGDEFNGHIDEFRISKGTDRGWTSNFTPPTSPYTTDANTKLLLHFNSDVSGQDHEITFNGDPQIAVTPTKWNGSYYFDGDDYLTIPDSEDWNFGTGEFTIDMWVKIIAHDGADVSSFCGQGPNTAHWMFRYYDGNLRFNLTASNVMSRSWSPILGQWYHIAVTRDGSNDMRLFVDGSQLGSAENKPDSMLNSGDDLNVGRCGGGSDYRYFNGYIDELRISDEALWTENFSVPSSPGVIDFYRLSGNLSDEVRILALNESSWAITENTTASGSGWSIDFDNDEAHTIIARKSDGESQGYGDMSPALV